MFAIIYTHESQMIVFVSVKMIAFLCFCGTDFETQNTENIIIFNEKQINRNTLVNLLNYVGLIEYSINFLIYLSSMYPKRMPHNNNIINRDTEIGSLYLNNSNLASIATLSNRRHLFNTKCKEKNLKDSSLDVTFDSKRNSLQIFAFEWFLQGENHFQKKF